MKVRGAEIPVEDDEHLAVHAEALTRLDEVLASVRNRCLDLLNRLMLDGKAVVALIEDEVNQIKASDDVDLLSLEAIDKEELRILLAGELTKSEQRFLVASIIHRARGVIENRNKEAKNA